MTSDILPNFNYKNKEMMDKDEFAISLLQKVLFKEDLNQFKYLDLSMEL